MTLGRDGQRLGARRSQWSGWSRSQSETFFGEKKGKDYEPSRSDEWTEPEPGPTNSRSRRHSTTATAVCLGRSGAQAARLAQRSGGCDLHRSAARCQVQAANNLEAILLIRDAPGQGASALRSVSPATDGAPTDLTPSRFDRPEKCGSRPAHAIKRVRRGPHPSPKVWREVMSADVRIEVAWLSRKAAP
jgi:hypothetical protein